MKLDFFLILFSFNFLIYKICFLLKIKKILKIYFPTYFSWHNQTMENVFQLIFYDTTKHKKIIYFSGIYFSKESLSKRKLLSSK
jgi:hypothetical protein